MSHFAVRKMASAGKLVFVADACHDRRYRPEEALHGKKMAMSILVLPLCLCGEVEGGIYADHRFKPLKRPADGDEGIEVLAALTAIALALRDGWAGGRELRALADRDLRSADEAATEAPPGRTGEARGTKVEDSDSLLAAEELLLASQGEPEVFEGLLSVNPDFRDVFDTIRSLSQSDLPVLLHGETGTGKSALARALHGVSKRRDGPFIPFHCGAVPESLIESELVGHLKGAFTGADADHEGVFVHANGGTLLLDEVADMSPDLQTKLLRVIEDGKVRALGAKTPLQVDVRILSSTSHDLEKMVLDGRFRRDLYFRLKAIVLEVPPLRDRREDVLPLARHFLELHANLERKPVPHLERLASLKLLRYRWPGNVREIKNEMRRIVALGRPVVQAAHLSIASRASKGRGLSGDDPGAPGASLQEAVAASEREAIREALEASGGNKSLAASRLGITRKSLYRRMAKYGLGSGRQ